MLRRAALDASGYVRLVWSSQPERVGGCSEAPPNMPDPAHARQKKANASCIGVSVIIVGEPKWLTGGDDLDFRALPILNKS